MHIDYRSEDRHLDSLKHLAAFAATVDTSTYPGGALQLANEFAGLCRTAPGDRISGWCGGTYSDGRPVLAHTACGAVVQPPPTRPPGAAGVWLVGERPS